MIKLIKGNILRFFFFFFFFHPEEFKIFMVSGLKLYYFLRFLKF
jgi:hypothetical protein